MTEYNLTIKKGPGYNRWIPTSCKYTWRVTAREPGQLNDKYVASAYATWVITGKWFAHRAIQRHKLIKDNRVVMQETVVR